MREPPDVGLTPGGFYCAPGKSFWSRIAIEYLDEFYDFISAPEKAESVPGKMCRSG